MNFDLNRNKYMNGTLFIVFPSQKTTGKLKIIKSNEKYLKKFK